MWRRYRFQTKAEDFRPLVFNPQYPWWVSGHAGGSTIICAYLPKDEDLLKYWDDAYLITYVSLDKIVFTERFPKPDYYVEEMKLKPDFSSTIEEINKSKQSGFFDLEEKKYCNHPNHNPPSYIHIPQGKGYRHICPQCGNVIEITPLQIKL